MWSGDGRERWLSGCRIHSPGQRPKSSSSPMTLLVWVRQGGAGSMEREKQVEKQKWYMIHIPGGLRQASV